MLAVLVTSTRPAADRLTLPPVDLATPVTVMPPPVPVTERSPPAVPEPRDAVAPLRVRWPVVAVPVASEASPLVELMSMAFAAVARVTEASPSLVDTEIEPSSELMVPNTALVMLVTLTVTSPLVPEALRLTVVSWPATPVMVPAAADPLSAPTVTEPPAEVTSTV